MVGWGLSSQTVKGNNGYTPCLQVIPTTLFVRSGWLLRSRMEKLNESLWHWRAHWTLLRLIITGAEYCVPVLKALFHFLSQLQNTAEVFN